MEYLWYGTALAGVAESALLINDWPVEFSIASTLGIILGNLFLPLNG